MENRDTHALNEKQMAFLQENFRNMNEMELYEKLSELGPEADPACFGAALKKIVKEFDSSVFDQAVSEEELDDIAGGRRSPKFRWCTDNVDGGYRTCTGIYYRDIYEGGFPNCAGTVEEGSWCDRNDACLSWAIVYNGRKMCGKAWE